MNYIININLYYSRTIFDINIKYTGLYIDIKTQIFYNKNKFF